MSPFDHFEAVWARCAQLSALHGYLEKNTSGVLQPDELLRAEWVARLSALDLYVHELVAQQMLEIFQGRRHVTPAFLRFQVSNDTLNRVRSAASTSDAGAAFDLEIREQLGHLTYQDPEKIAEGVRLCSTVELWHAVALRMGASQATKTARAQTLKRELSLIVRRRNKIAHEGDLHPSTPREPLPLTKSDLSYVENTIKILAESINDVVI